MRLGVVGQPRWVGVLTELLNRHCGDILTATAINGRSMLATVSFRSPPDVLLRVGFRPGAPTLRGIGFDGWWSLVRRLHPSVPTVYYWIGTDLFNLMRDAAARRLRRPFFHAARESKHLAAAPWFIGDLERLGIRARLLHFPIPLPDLARPFPLPDEFSVFTYLPEGREDHYGGDTVLLAAREMSSVPFVVVGRDGRAVDGAPGNVRSLPRTPTLDDAYASASVVLRLARHDGVGATVKEGLVHARPVVYSYPFPFTHHVPYGDPARLLAVLQDLQARQARGDLALNLEGRSYALAEFDPAHLAHRLAAVLSDAAS